MLAAELDGLAGSSGMVLLVSKLPKHKAIGREPDMQQNYFQYKRRSISIERWMAVDDVISARPVDTFLASLQLGFLSTPCSRGIDVIERAGSYRLTSQCVRDPFYG